MNKTWVPKVAGILLIVTGAIQIVFSTPILVVFLLSGSAGIIWLEAEWALVFGPLAISGILAIVGGIHALKNKNKYLVLTGAIAAFLPCAYWPVVFILLGSRLIFHIPLFLVFFGVLFTFFLAMGIAAIILVAPSKKQFERK